MDNLLCPSAAEAASRDFLSVFEGEAFAWDPFTDSQVVFGDKTFYCHRNVLAKAGSGFRAQFLSLMDGADPNVFHVDVPGVHLDENGVEAFMFALYKPASLEKVEDVAVLEQVYRLLDYYGAQAIMKLCIDRLVQVVSNVNARDLLILGHQLHLLRLTERCLVIIAQLGEAALQEPGWPEFAKDHPAMMLTITQRFARNRDRANRAKATEKRAEQRRRAGQQQAEAARRVRDRERERRDIFDISDDDDVDWGFIARNRGRGRRGPRRGPGPGAGPGAQAEAAAP